MCPILNVRKLIFPAGTVTVCRCIYTVTALPIARDRKTSWFVSSVSVQVFTGAGHPVCVCTLTTCVTVGPSVRSVTTSGCVGLSVPHSAVVMVTLLSALSLSLLTLSRNFATWTPEGPA